MAHFSLSWDAYKSNICKGLSALQQNGEFVDMTLAADGHHVKVHQMVMSLGSPYIKDIITSTHCQHPVIFLNILNARIKRYNLMQVCMGSHYVISMKISYTTLCAILEYIYTGEVLVAKDNLNEVIEAAKELRIKGLEDMKTLDISATETFSHSSQALVASHNEGQALDSSYQYKDPDPNELRFTRSKDSKKEIKEMQETTDDEYEDTFLEDGANDTYDTMETDNTAENIEAVSVRGVTKGGDPRCQVQYTLSNQGSLQMILNRYVYNLRYTSRRDNSQRQWRCIDLRDRKCQATVITKGETVVNRISVHNHSFHDHKILKKVRDKAIFSAIRDAVTVSASKMKERHSKSKADGSRDNE